MSQVELEGAISLKSRAYTDPLGCRTTMKPPLLGEVRGGERWERKEGSREGREREEERGGRGGKRGEGREGREER